MTIATSLFGGALLLFDDNVAIAQSANSYYSATVANLGTLVVAAPAVVTLGGYNTVGDGGGGSLVTGPTAITGCTTTITNGETFAASGGVCLYRTNPTNNVREWGAKCDVVAVQSQTATWTPTMVDPNTMTNVGALVVQSLLTPPPTPGQSIVISQVGGPTLWGGSPGSPAKTAMWATRFSKLSATGSNYAPGDLISFIGGTNPGTFSQQIAIIVDSVTGAHNSVGQWHFLWGGLYDPTNPPDATFRQDNGRSYRQNSGSGAILTPAWSGWSLLNNQTIPSAGVGMNYKVGDTITLSESTGDGSVVNQGHYPVLVVESVNSSNNNAVETYDWLDYGSYYTLPTNPMVLTSTVTNTGTLTGAGSGFTITPVQWTRGPLATTIADVVYPNGPNTTPIDIYVSENFATASNPAPNSAFPTPMPIQYYYYGDNDSPSINAALKSQSAASIATGNGAAFSLPGSCGTTAQINLPQDTSANVVNPSLIGGNFQSTGLYAFAAPLSGRAATPVLSRVVYGGLANTNGGGLRDMQIEAMGVPQGFGYYGLAQNVGLPGPTGAYIGPRPLTPPAFLAPAAGDVVEIDAGTSMRLDNLHVSDGGIGSGNAVFQCGIDESDPTAFVRGGGVASPALVNAVIANIAFTGSRLDGNNLLSGATDPDFAMRLDNSCRNSVYRALTVYDGTKADMLQYNANQIGQLHVNSDAVNSGGTLASPIAFTALNSYFAGVADYGVYALGGSAISQTQCDIANWACVYMTGNTNANLLGPGQITDTQMKCGGLQSVAPAYHGVELGTGVVNITVSGTAASSQCNVSAAQLLVVDSAVDPTVSLCNNSNALQVFCAGNQNQSGFAASRNYTQPALFYASVGLTGSAPPASTNLYAIPFINPTGGAITQIGLHVAATGGTASLCELGIYSTVAGAPGALLLDAGPVAVGTTGKKTLTVPSFLVLPNTLYFLAVGCNGTVTVQGTLNTNGPLGLLLGEPDYITFGATSVTTIWPMFAANGLPTPFGPATLAATVNVPNVYVTP